MPLSLRYAIYGLLFAAVVLVNAWAAEPAVIDHSRANTRIYLGSPSIAVLPSGIYVASHDYFGPGSSLDTTAVFTSSDRGRTWSKLAEIKGQWWSTLFFHAGQLYLFGVNRESGFVAIRRSADGGQTWTVPANAETGLLLAETRYGCGPGAVVVHGGRIWRAMEELLGGEKPNHFHVFMMSAPADADLLKASNWTSSNAVASNPAWLEGQFGGWLEGNAVVGPDDQMLDILRAHCTTGTERAAIVHVTPDGRTATFDPQQDIVEFPGGSKKFTIRFDPASRSYWALTNPVPPTAASGYDHIRNILALSSSPDLRKWTVRAVISYHPDVKKHAFQYADWLFDGDDLIAVIRTANDDAFGGAHTFHAANFLTFQRIEHFRDLVTKSAPVSAESTADSRDFSVSGSGFAIARLNDNATAFTNRNYVWQQVPPLLSGRCYTQAAGGGFPHLIVHARRDAVLEVITAIDQPGLKLPPDWEQTASAFTYNDGKHTRVVLLRKRLTAGQDLEIPRGNWSGVLVLFPD